MMSTRDPNSGSTAYLKAEPAAAQQQHLAPAPQDAPAPAPPKVRLVYEPWRLILGAPAYGVQVDCNEWVELARFATEERARDYAELYARGPIVIAEFEIAVPGSPESARQGDR